MLPLEQTISTSQDKFVENAIVTFDVELQKFNCIEVTQHDKTNQDLLDTVDHWIRICDISVDGVHFETALFNSSSKFEHSMSSEWVADLKNQGHTIEPCYRPGTELRLNGTWSTQFSNPVWKWCVENYSL
jgi:hypothetical protein